MPKFMFVFRGGGYGSPEGISPTDLEKHLAKWNEWTSSLLGSGRNASAHALSYPPTGRTLRGREKVVTDGPYAETKDLVSGIVVFEASSLDEAAELAKGCPIFEFGGSVEVRPVLSPPQ